MNMCFILKGYRDTAVGTGVLCSTPLYSDSLDFCLCGWLKSQVYKRNVDTWDELLARILDAAAHINRRAAQLRRKIHDLPTGAAQSIKADSGIF